MTEVVERAAASDIDAKRLRSDFPIFRRHIHGHRLVYLDSAATSQKPETVLAAIDRYYRESNANVHRGVYLLAEDATELFESARSSVARFIGAPESAEVIFTRNASEAINLVAYAWGRHNISGGDVIVTTPLEHHSNFVPWQILASQVGADLALVELHPDGTLDLDSLDALLARGRVKLVTVAWVSNVLGTINPVQVIARRAHDAGALVLFDAAQAAPHLPLDVSATEADFVAITGHKMLGPMGIGVLWARRKLLEEMPPFLAGGEMIRRVTEQGSTWNELPWKFEAGTPNVEGAIGLQAAVEYLEALGMDAIRAHERRLVGLALERLQQIDGLRLLGPEDADLRGGVVAFDMASVHPHDLASILDRTGVCIRAGHHCAQPLHDRLGIAASARASFYVYNDEDDVDVLVEGIETAKRVMGA
ncbi:MAG TPA: cysteine desulfurase [Chloroflexota bacterium]|nr:cysteine desulfurase [Chloroflexota bacterium]